MEMMYDGDILARLWQDDLGRGDGQAGGQNPKFHYVITQENAYAFL